MAKQYEQMKLPDRPKRWKQKAFEVMNEAVHTRQEIVFIYSFLPVLFYVSFMLLKKCNISVLVQCGFDILISCHTAFTLILRICNSLSVDVKSILRKTCVGFTSTDFAMMTSV